MRHLGWIVVCAAVLWLLAGDPGAAFAADGDAQENRDAYRAGQIVAYVTMASIGLYYLVRWLRNRK